MREIIEYKISCLSQIPQDLADGWQPLGGPIMVAQRIHQAMVKYEEEPSPTVSVGPLIDPITGIPRHIAIELESEDEW